MSAHYIGVTLGPLGATMSLAGSPAGLWTSSYLFSYLADTLCRLLTEHGVPAEAFVVPYYDPTDPLVQSNREAGLYHDRIIFRGEGFPIEDFAAIRRQAVAETARAFTLDEEYLSRYLLIEAAAFEAENPIAESEPILNSLELSPPFVAAETENPLITLFTTNWKLRATPLMQSMGQWHLMREDGGFKDGCQIVSVGDTRAQYYAMVRGDGDRTGGLLRSLGSDEEIRAFSKDCLTYCAAVAALTREHDGFTVYAGGDDLLVLLPLVDGQGRQFPDFLLTASRLYKETFSRYSPAASISFGVAIARVNMPLYQVLETATTLLFRHAKSRHDAVALHLSGRRGDADGLVMRTEALPALLELLKTEGARHAFSTGRDVLRQYAPLFAIATDLSQFRQLLSGHTGTLYQQHPFLNETLPTLLHQLREGFPLWTIPDAGEEDLVEKTCYLLDLLFMFAGRGYLQ